MIKPHFGEAIIPPNLGQQVSLKNCINFVVMKNNIEKINKVIFKKDSTLIDSLSYENIDKIINYYFTDDDYFRTTLKITQNQKYNILFFFFKNEYYISSSDYDGSFSIIKK
ncbi:hypothetical protein DSECCO2_507680 [anaerobic digester metagenome]